MVPKEKLAFTVKMHVIKSTEIDFTEIYFGEINFGELHFGVLLTSPVWRALSKTKINEYFRVYESKCEHHRVYL